VWCVQIGVEGARLHAENADDQEVETGPSYAGGVKQGKDVSGLRFARVR